MNSERLTTQEHFTTHRLIHTHDRPIFDDILTSISKVLDEGYNTITCQWAGFSRKFIPGHSNMGTPLTSNCDIHFISIQHSPDGLTE